MRRRPPEHLKAFDREGEEDEIRIDLAAYYSAMERVAEVLLRSLARSVGLRSDYFDDSFRHGLSTLRLIRYPPRDPAELAKVQDPAVWVGSGRERFSTPFFY